MKYSGMTLKIQGQNCKQINRPTANRLFNNGIDIFLHPSKMALLNPWQSPININIERLDNYTFEEYVNNFDFYTPAELGNYPNFFTKI